MPQVHSLKDELLFLRLIYNPWFWLKLILALIIHNPTSIFFINHIFWNPLYISNDMEPMLQFQIKLQSLALIISVETKYLANSLINKILHAHKILPHIKEKIWLCRHKASTDDDWSIRLIYRWPCYDLPAWRGDYLEAKWD